MPGLLVVDGIAAQFGAALQWLVGNAFRNAAVDHVDRAADGAAAVEQGGRALQYLDLFGQERLDADCVVDADRRHVAGAQSVAEHLHARTVEAAHDRPADAGAEIRRLHAGQLVDGLAQRVGLDLVQLLTGQYLDGTDQVLGRAGQGRGVDFDRVQILGVVLVATLGLLSRAATGRTKPRARTRGRRGGRRRLDMG